MTKYHVASGKCRSQSLPSADLLLQPWFLDKKRSSAIRRMMPEFFIHKMRFYFQDWGCLVCSSKKRRYASNGMCNLCAIRIQKRLCRCLQKRALKAPEHSPTVLGARQVDRVRIAKTLLSDFACREWSPIRLSLRSSIRRTKSVNSPVSRSC